MRGGRGSHLSSHGCSCPSTNPSTLTFQELTEHSLAMCYGDRDRGNVGGARHRDRDGDAELGSGPAGTTACSVSTCTARSWSGAKLRGDHGSHHRSWRYEVAWGPTWHGVFPSTTPTHLEMNRGLRRVPTALHSRSGRGRQLRLHFLFKLHFKV